MILKKEARGFETIRKLHLAVFNFSYAPELKPAGQVSGRLEKPDLHAYHLSNLF